MKLPLSGPSYSMRSRAAGVQRSVNLYPAPLESGNERAGFVLRDVPGLVLAATGGAEHRGSINLNGRLFVVTGGTLYERSAAYVDTPLGAIAGAGPVGMTFNTTQLVVSNGVSLHVLDLATNVLASFVFPGGRRIHFLDQYIFFVHRDTQQFGWTDVGDASNVDGLSFASAEGAPDRLVDLVVDRRELVLGGAASVELWSTVGGDSVVARNSGAFVETGVAAEFTMRQCGGAVLWLSDGTRGAGRVYRLDGYREVPISTDAVEQLLEGRDLSGARAFTVDIDGHSFYLLNVPGLDRTLAYDMKTGAWHDWCELVGGEFVPHRAVDHVFCFGLHFVFGADGRMYRLDPNASSNAGDPLCRARVFPVSATPSRERVPYGTLHLDCDRGYGGTVQMRYSNDGTAPAGGWRVVSMGEIGDRSSRVKWDRCGSARDRVFEIRCTDNVPFNPVSAEVM